MLLTFASCGSCRACGDGHPSLCARFAELNYATPPDYTTEAGTASGGWLGRSSWASAVVAHESAAVVLPDGVPWDVAAALACGVLTGAGTVFTVLEPGPRDALLVIGAGTTGHAAVMAARVRGVARIVVSEPSEVRRALARQLGATDAGEPAEVETLLRGSPATHALDTVGSQEALDSALRELATGGTCATVALRPGRNMLEVSQSALLWGRRLVGVIEGDAVPERDVSRLAALWAAGLFPVEHLISRYPFDAIERALADAGEGHAVVKPVLLFGDGELPDAAPHPWRSPAELARAGELRETDLPGLWRSLPPVRPDELRGLWRGWGLSPTQRMSRVLARHDWFGKLFASADDVAPIVVRRDGALHEDAALARGSASIRWGVHEGLTTAAMVYDHLPIVDLFVRLDADTVLGVMTGRDAADDGHLFHFALERAESHPVRRAQPDPA
ncbi:zinc-binding dehydrogenase [Salinibacterium sp. ZJ70]|uniref:zinc-binding dehydrogenase n=1 Tax=Salinibacterium sp. ZJ70 TaxID=2708084 RepID=UPI0014247F3F|nr:zinc-binding dehydrogenase [Salinibacterium sp. ZJ70]